MSLSAGTAFVDVQPQIGAGFQAALGGKLSGIIPGIGSQAGAALATGIVGGAAAVVAGAGALGVAATSKFADLQAGLQEVRTLLPTLSDEGFAQLRDDVQNFANEAGVATTEVVPALYQAISAGVPVGNVFDFLGTANKAALGGVTDLQTSVDGLTSVVNAYGSDVISTAEASDLMFTTVRLGKTNFGELSASLFQVIPTAAGAGVAFSDISAALAALTAQGTPTSVATTQLRQVITELAKDGTKVGEAFERTAGTSFRDFIAGGGNLQDALGILSTSAADAGLNVTDLFGSVEAGNAVLGLTSSNGAQLFTNALGEMAEASGSTEAAFETMDQGLSRTWDKIKVQIGTGLTEVGERLAPFVERFAEWFADTLPVAIDAFLAIVEKLRPVFEAVFGFVSSVLDGFKGSTEGAVGPAGEAFATFGNIVKSIAELIRIQLDGLRAFWDQWGGTITAVVVNAFKTIGAVIGGALKVIQGVLDIFLGILSGDWSRVWEGVKAIFAGVWQAIAGIFSGVVNNALALADKLFGGLREKVRTGLDNVVGFFRDLPGRIFGFLTGLPDRLRQLGADLINGLIGGLGDIAGRIATKLREGISKAIANVKSFFGISSPSKVVAAQLGLPIAEGVALGAEATGQLTGDVLASGISSAVAGARDALTGAASAGRVSAVAGFDVAGAGNLAGDGNGPNIILEEGAVQVFNPTPEPASLTVPRELRRLALTLGKA